MALCLVLGCGEREHPSTSEPQAPYVEQQVEERSFNDWTLEEVRFDEPVSIGNAIDIKIYNDRLFVWDAAPMSIKRYTLDGELDVTYGNGEGQGPGEFEGIFSFAALGTEEVWIVDTEARKVSRFRYDGTFIESVHPDGRPARIEATGKNRFALSRAREPKLFALVNSDGEVLKRFGKVLDVPQERYTLILDGQLYPNPDGGFVWGPRWASYLYSYNANGTLERRIELIDGYPFPVEQMQPNPLQSAPDEWPQRTQSVSVTDDEIFVTVGSEEPLT